MIDIKFMKECENCPYLEVTQNTECITTLASGNEYQHTISCERMDECTRLIEHLRKEIQKNGN